MRERENQERDHLRRSGDNSVALSHIQLEKGLELQVSWESYQESYSSSFYFLAFREKWEAKYQQIKMKAPTKNFDLANKIAEGGFGSVYKRILSDGTVIAVKQLSSKSKQGITHRKKVRRSWSGKLKSFVADGDKKQFLGQRAEILLHSMRLRLPGPSSNCFRYVQNSV